MNEACNLLAIVVYNMKNVMDFWNMFYNPTTIVATGYLIREKSYTIRFFHDVEQHDTIKIACDNRKQKSHRVNRP